MSLVCVTYKLFNILIKIIRKFMDGFKPIVDRCVVFCIVGYQGKSSVGWNESVT